MNQGPVGRDRGWWVENVFRPLAIGVMFGCIALSLVELVRLVFPAWSGTYLVVGCVLAALEANYSYRLIRARSLRGFDRLRFRAIEIALFYPVLKIGSYLGDSWASVLADIQSWPRNPGGIFDLETLAAFLLALISWHVAGQTTGDYERLDEPPEYHRYYVSPLDSMAGRFFEGGLVLLVAAGLTRAGLAHLLNLSRPPVHGLILNVLVYFLVGLVMLGQVRFATLRKRWQAQEIKVSDELPGRWVRYSLAFIGLVAGLAFLLPTGYTLGLLDVIGWTLGAILGFLSLVFTVLFWLFMLPLAWLLSWLGLVPSQLGLDQPLSRLPPQNQDPPVAPDWLQILRSLVFWAIVLGILFYLVRSYLRDHPELAKALANLGLVRALRDMWSAFRRSLRSLGGWGKAVMERLPRHWALPLRRRGTSNREPLGFFRLRGLPPREQVLYYYLSILQRAGRQGLARRPAQTPEEYRSALDPNLLGAHRPLEQLTRAFMEARYSRHVVDSDQVRGVRASWQQVKAALSRLRRKTDG